MHLIYSKNFSTIYASSSAHSAKEAVVEAARNGHSLCHAMLPTADLTQANLKRVDLRHADLRGADLRYADLTRARLEYADLTGAKLDYATVNGCKFYGAKLPAGFARNCYWGETQEDVNKILDGSPREVAALRQAIVNGKIDGSTYTGDCCCLAGTIAKAKGCRVEDIGRDPSRLAEVFFMSIQPGDKPESNQFSALALLWVDRWISANGHKMKSEVETLREEVAKLKADAARAANAEADVKRLREKLNRVKDQLSTCYSTAS